MKLIIPTTVCVLPVPGGPDNRRRRGLRNGCLVIATALLIATDCEWLKDTPYYNKIIIIVIVRKSEREREGERDEVFTDLSIAVVFVI